MNWETCLNCTHSNADRTNDFGEIRCEKFHTYVEPTYKCDYHSCKGIQELAEKLKRSDAG